jgi:arsenate reductase (glutaredoxin)
MRTRGMNKMSEKLKVKNEKLSGKKVALFYNPRCSKCREAYSLLNEKGCEVEIIEYLKDAPTEKELKEVLRKLGLKAQDLLRKKEPLFAEKYIDRKLTNAQWIKVMCKNPILIERPVAIYGSKAVIGKPVERVVEIL